jgi:hypothetical protein
MKAIIQYYKKIDLYGPFMNWLLHKKLWKGLIYNFLFYLLFSDKFISVGCGRLFKRKPDGPLYARGNYITFHSGICKGVRVVKGNDNRVQAAVVLDGKRN